MSLLEYILDWNDKNNSECPGCSHPSGKCSHSASEKCLHPSTKCLSECKHNCGCQRCLNEIHYTEPTEFYDENGKLIKRQTYNCPKLIKKYISKYLKRYCENIKFACEESIGNFDNYPYLSVCSIGCGPSPDLMAFEEISKDKSIIYYGIDNNQFWNKTHNKIKEFILSQKRKIINEYFYYFNEPLYYPYYCCNIIIIQYFISTLFKLTQKNVLKRCLIILRLA